jgi:hypothetical protein
MKRWDELIKRVPSDVPSAGAEVGVLRGATALQVLRKCPRATHIMVDPWESPSADSRYRQSFGKTQQLPQEKFDQMYEQLLEKVRKYGERAKVWRARSKDAAEKVEAHSLDYVFIDAEHTYEAVRDDIIAWLPKVKQGGWIGGHDYDNPGFEGVKEAVDEAFPDGVERGADHTWWRRIG